MESNFDKSSKLHTPEELLKNAEELFATNNPKMYRASILEAITALEAFVEETVFKTLDKLLDPILVKWLRDRSKMDFDSRLGVFTPLATGIEIDKDQILWKNYKEAKKIRNKITHTGAVAQREQAKFVIDTVYAWLAHLGSTSELKASFLDFKYLVEQKKIIVNSGQQGVKALADYFQGSAAVIGQPDLEKDMVLKTSKIKYDLLLEIGTELIVVEVKYLVNSRANIFNPSWNFNDHIINASLLQVNLFKSLLKRDLVRLKIETWTNVKAIVLLFHDEDLPMELVNKPLTVGEAEIYLIRANTKL